MATGGDGAVLKSAVGREQLAIFCYRRLAGLRSLPPATRHTASRLLGQEREHAVALTSALRRLGGRPPTKPASVAAADRELHSLGVAPGLGEVVDGPSAITFGIALENALIRGCESALGSIQAPSILTVVTQVLANEAQHVALWRGAASIAPADVVPAAFERGHRPGP